ncbi:MAG TPA: hypothetical protein VGI16_05535 [Candidatus Acidoferrum sp.]
MMGQNFLCLPGSGADGRGPRDAIGLFYVEMLRGQNATGVLRPVLGKQDDTFRQFRQSAREI